MVMKDKRFHKSHPVYLIKTVNKRVERSSQSYDNSNVSPYARVVLPFILHAKQWRMKLRMLAELVKIRRMIRVCGL